jgi:hypothetical protein
MSARRAQRLALSIEATMFEAIKRLFRPKTWDTIIMVSPDNHVLVRRGPVVLYDLDPATALAIHQAVGANTSKRAAHAAHVTPVASAPAPSPAAPASPTKRAAARK